METFSAKIAVTGLIFLLIGLLAVWVKVIEGENPSDAYKVVFGLCIFCGAPACLGGILSYIWF